MKIGILINKLDNTPNNIKIVQEINKLSLTYNIVLFVSEQGELSTNCLTPIFYHKEAWLYEGIIIANCLQTAESLITMPGPTGKYLYNWELEWAKLSRPDFTRINKIYQNINLLANSESDQITISKIWKRPVTLCSNFNIENFLKDKSNEKI